MLRNKTDPLQDTVIMPMDGSTYGRARHPMHTGLLTAKGKEKQKKNPKQTLPIHDVPFALHFRRGSRQPPGPLSKPRARPRRRSRRPCQGLAVSGLCWWRPAAGDFRAAGARTRGPCRPRAQGLGTRTRALTCATSHASDATTAEGGHLCLLENHLSSSGIRNLIRFA